MPSLGIAPHPGGCAGPAKMLAQDTAPVTGVFPAGAHFHLLEIKVQAIHLYPYHAGPATRRPVRLNTRDFRCLGCREVFLSPCSVSVLESVSVMAFPGCAHGCCPRVAAGLAGGSTGRGPGRGGSLLPTGPSWRRASRSRARTR